MPVVSGFAIRSGHGYYEMNGIGDWSLAGDAETCSIFDTVEEARQEITEWPALDDTDLVIVPITRSVEVTVGEAP